MSVNHIRSALSRSFRKFLRNTAGNMSMVLGVAAIPTFIVATAAIDTARITREQTAFYNAVDSAALAIAADERSSLNGLTGPEIVEREKLLQEYAVKYIKANYADTNGGASNIDVDITITGQDVKLTADLEFPTLLAPVLALVSAETRKNGVTNQVESVNGEASAVASDFATLVLHAESTVNKAMKPIELVMVMDTTGSMRNDMVGLKAAANKLLATLYGDASPTAKNMKSEYIRTALVPFSAAVRLDTTAFDYNASWIDTTGTNPLSTINFNNTTLNNYSAWGVLKKSSSAYQTWNGCVESRTHSGVSGVNYITSDTAPTLANAASRFPAYFNPDSPSFYTGSNASKYRTTSGSQVNGTWNNPYISAYTNYSTTINTSLQAPSGSRKTGYDDSTILNNSTSFDARFKNTEKYRNTNIGSETFTLGSDNVSWSVNNGPWKGCTASKLVPMTYDRAKVEAGIASMKAYGGTNIAEGLAWGMRAISPTEPFTLVEGATGIPSSTIAPYNGPRWQKVLVLMSDGMNDPYARYSNGSIAAMTDTGTTYNSFGMSTTPTTLGLNRYGSTNIDNADNTMDTYTSQVCENLKENGVTIYTISFGLENNVLKNCASTEEHYRTADTVPELVALFDHIGQDVLNKMVYVSN